MSSGIDVTFYAVFEYLGDFDEGEALIAVLENGNFGKNEILETKKVKKSKFSEWSPKVLGRFVGVRSDVKPILLVPNRQILGR